MKQSLLIQAKRLNIVPRARGVGAGGTVDVIDVLPAGSLESGVDEEVSVPLTPHLLARYERLSFLFVLDGVLVNLDGVPAVRLLMIST